MLRDVSSSAFVSCFTPCIRKAIRGPLTVEEKNLGIALFIYTSMQRAFIEDLQHVGHMEALSPALSPCSHSTHQASSLLSAGATVSRTNSCQSDSSGFLEEPPDPPALQVGADSGLEED